MNTGLGIGRVFRELEDVSKRHFGRKARLPTAAVAASADGPVWARHVAGIAGLGENQAAAELREMVALGALQVVPASYDRRVVYQRISHPFWDFVVATVDETIRQRLTIRPESFWDELEHQSDPRSLQERGG